MYMGGALLRLSRHWGVGVWDIQAVPSASGISLLYAEVLYSMYVTTGRPGIPPLSCSFLSIKKKKPKCNSILM